MANLYVTEYDRVASHGFDGGGSVPIPTEPALATQVVDYSGGAAASGAFKNETKLVRIMADTDCHVLFGATPTATAGDQYVVAYAEYWRAVKGTQKVSAISA